MTETNTNLPGQPVLPSTDTGTGVVTRCPSTGSPGLPLIKNFTEEHVQTWQPYPSSPEGTKSHQTIRCLRKDLYRQEPRWMKAGLQETASGYGARLNSGWMIRFEGKLYRIYTTCYSNNGSCWFKTKGRKIFVDAT